MTIPEILEALLAQHEKSLEADEKAHAAAIVAAAAHDEYLHALGESIAERRLLVERLRKATEADFFARRTPLPPPPLEPPPPPGMRPAPRYTPPARRKP